MSAATSRPQPRPSATPDRSSTTRPATNRHDPRRHALGQTGRAGIEGGLHRPPSFFVSAGTPWCAYIKAGGFSMAAPGSKVLELTFRGLVLGVLITLVFTAANVYLGLKVGLTFATSIPAAVISMAVLSAFKTSTILENNIVQTVASAAGTLSAIIFLLPGLVIVGWWVGFPFVTSFLICASGGILGVLFTIPLRRAMVTTSDLPYPEGVAAAEVLEVGEAARSQSGAESREGLLAVVWGAVASAGLAILAATRIATAEFTKFFLVSGGAASGIDMGYSLCLLYTSPS